jgi:hypothetical protein
MASDHGQLPTMKDVEVKDEADSNSGNDVGVSGTALGNHRSAPKWIELLPAGEFAGRDGRGPFRLSNPAAVIAATNRLRLEAELPIDYDHATDFGAPAGRPAPAAGWIRTIEARNGALWGQVEWTRHGASAVVTQEYRYISPVFEYSEDGEVQRLLRAALTNNQQISGSSPGTAPQDYLVNSTAYAASAQASKARDRHSDALGSTEEPGWAFSVDRNGRKRLSRLLAAQHS